MRQKRYLLCFLVYLSLAFLFQGCSALATPSTATAIPSPLVPTETRALTKTTAPLDEPTPTTQETSVPSEVLETEQPTPTPSEPARNALLQLTFISDRTGKSSVYAIDVYCWDFQDSCLGEPRLLFDRDERINNIDWSPDGAKVAFTTGYRGILFIADWNGENVTQITEKCGSAGFPEWSLDGKRIAFIYQQGQKECESLGTGQIQVYDLETGQINTILQDAYSPTRVYWLPDNDMAYISRPSENEWIERINIVRPDGTILQQIPENAEEFYQILGAAFSPDASSLVFVGDIWRGEATTDIYYVDLNGRDIINLSNGSGHNFTPEWSPHRDWLAFESNRTKNFDIYLVKPDGSGLINITQNSADDGYPAWRNVDSP